MLMLPSAISGISPKYSGAFDPGMHFVLDWTAINPLKCSNNDRQMTSAPDMESLQARTSTLGISRSSAWVSSAQDSFYHTSAGHMSPSQERLRSQLPPEIHMAGRGLPRSLPMESLRPLSFVSGSGVFSSDPTSYAQLEPVSQSIQEEHDIDLRRLSQDSYAYQSEPPTSHSYTEYEAESHSRRGSDMGRNTPRYHSRRRPFNQDEFDGPSQLLPLPLPQQELARSQALPHLPLSLSPQEQDEVAHRVNNILSQCAFHFVAKYQFPIPLERDKPHVRSASDREWTEWAYLLKRLATKRRIPARVLFENQIKQFVTILENSIPARQSRDQQLRTPKDDRCILQLISASTQVAKILLDSHAMAELDNLYQTTESLMMDRGARRNAVGYH